MAVKKEKQYNPFESWAKAISQLNLRETLYVRKENPDEGKYRVIDVAENFFNPDMKVVTFYCLQDEKGIKYFLDLERFKEQFEAVVC